MSINRLKLNKDKTELFYLFSKYNLQQSLPLLRFGTESSPLHMQEILALSSIPLCQCFPMWTMFVNLPFIIFTPFPAQGNTYQGKLLTEILVHAFVTSKLDHCNSLLYNVPKNVIKKLQSVQNAAARLITRFRKCDHITPILVDLQWLPVSERIKFKILLLTFKALHQQSLTYIQDPIIRYLPSSSFESSFTLSLNPVSFNLKTYRSRAFSVSAPELWNKLPDENLSLFKHKLKTHLFKNYYFSH